MKKCPEKILFLLSILKKSEKNPLTFEKVQSKNEKN